MNHSILVKALAGSAWPTAILRLLALAFLITSVSCASSRRYVQPQGSADRLALLEAHIPVRIASIDGASTVPWKKIKTQQIYITPGRHIIEVYYAGTTSDIEEELGEVDRGTYPVISTRVMLPLNAAPGETYQIAYNLDRHLGKVRVEFFIPMFQPLP
ncbi:MAG TPA: hypothetical protein VEH04_07465 [Verrucomicrobiae bacterium]|nr:hypothetical protein [Verrucomicrobiae bacterium]